MASNEADNPQTSDNSAQDKTPGTREVPKHSRSPKRPLSSSITIRKNRSNLKRHTPKVNKHQMIRESPVFNETASQQNINEFIESLHKSGSDAGNELLSSYLMKPPIENYQMKANQFHLNPDVANASTGQDNTVGTSDFRKREQNSETLTNLQLFRSRNTHFYWDDAILDAIQRRRNIMQFVGPLFKSERDSLIIPKTEGHTFRTLLPIPSSMSSLICMLDNQMKPQMPSPAPCTLIRAPKESED